MNPTLEQMERLHEIGFSIIVLNPHDKSPKQLKGWNSGPRKTREQLKKEFTPGDNVGVRLGETSQIRGALLCCLDVDANTDDPDELDAMNSELARLMGEIHAPTVISGGSSSSVHKYLLCKKELKPIVLAKSDATVTVNRKRKGVLEEATVPAWAITLYSGGRQMVLPPSVHPTTGEQYRWESEAPKNKDAFPEVPEAWISGAAETVAPESIAVPRDWAARHVTVAELRQRLPATTTTLIVDGAPQGGRSERILDVAKDLCRAGFTDGEIAWVLTNREWGISSKPFDERGSRPSAVEWVQKYAIQPARQRVGGSAEDAFERLDMTDNGKPRSTLKNLILLFKRASPAGKKWIARNEFVGVDVYRGEMPWGGEIGQELGDADASLAKVWLSQHHGIKAATTDVLDAFTVMAIKNKFHPVRDYLNSLEWDGKPRVGSWLKKYLHAVAPGGDETVLADISRKFLLAAVSRVMTPGCKFDYVLILEGKQGVGKSSAILLLAGLEWGGEGKIDVDRPVDSALLVRGKWIFEMPECLGLHKKDAESIKAFFSKQIDRGRDPYERKPKDTPRQCVFVGTTNRNDYLTDSTGNRRFWPVEVGQCDFAALARDRDQLWAEAYFLWNFDREPLWLSPESERVIAKSQAERMVEDPWLDRIAALLREDEELAELHQLNKMQLQDILSKMSISDPDLRQVGRAGGILRQLGYRKSRRQHLDFSGTFWVKE